uniref:Protein translocase subunit SecA n=1 Tax=Dipterosiphonia australica TaxID=2007208 RepID=A0A1Z1ML07_9FLOR|nr:preprotein-translocase subunit a [Dipterosiphonia australica]ARW66777.1 preprotein-translocase subunit a [Dipterosiphonia australica]
MLTLFPYSTINRSKKTVININKKQIILSKYPDIELKKQTDTLKLKIHNSNLNKDEILIEAFATIKEAIQRSLKITLFDVQILGGIILNNNSIAEMKTGEGKTLAALLPAYLNCLMGKGVHIITVNDYLAERDANLAKIVFSYVNIQIGIITQKTPLNKRKDEYQKDITYITNSELGFDYLKDNMAIHQNNIIQRDFYYAIIDEVDSILIDEARTPLIISGVTEANNKFYQDAQNLCKLLHNKIHYKIDEKSKNIILTEQGIAYCEELLKINNLYDINTPWIKYIINGLKAKELFLKNRDYIIKNKQVVIVDEFTGRIMEGRRWSDGLHQSIEAKENINIESENKTLASITYQNLFLLYQKLSGMTGTAKTEENEFLNIYKMDVISVPTNKKCLRKDLSDLVYKNEYNKWEAIAKECMDMYNIGRPTLIGTTSIQKSELLSQMLKEMNIPHNLLNAKPENVSKEAETILQAGKKGSITISTNMAGRGTDIILGDHTTNIVKQILEQYKSTQYSKLNKYQRIETILNQDELKVLFNTIKHQNHKITEKQLTQLENNYDIKIQTIYTKLVNQCQTYSKEEKKEILTLGGLYVIGTERHESRRIDNQLRGRSGRQGDKGSSRFFLSLEDNLFRIFGGKTIENLVTKLNIDDTVPIESILLTKSLNSAQKKVEAYFYDIRKQLYEYDEVINNQRKAIYNERKKILKSASTRDCIIEYAECTIQEMLKIYTKTKRKERTLRQIIQILNIKIEARDLLSMNINQMQNYINEQFRISYDLKEIYLEQLRPGLIRQLEKYYLLQQIDKAWQEHIDKINLLKEYIGWRSYGQQDPIIEYKNEAFHLFINMIMNIRQTVVYLMMRSRLIIDL